MTDAEILADLASTPLPSVEAPETPRGHRTAPESGDPYVVCVNKRTYYVRTEDGWTPPLAPENIAMELRRAWPPTDGRKALRLIVPNVKGDSSREMKPAEILERFGRHAHGVVYTYLHARYEYERETVYLPVARRVAIEPRRSEQAEEYLTIALGSEHERVLDWLATYTNLREPTAALTFTGPKFSGKSTLLHAISAPWGGWADLGLVLGDFQDAARLSPVWAADEGLALPSKRGTVRLREAITARGITVNPKGHAAGPLEGAPRVVTGSNDVDPYKFGSELFNEDSAAAIASRIIHIPIPASAAEYLGAHRDVTASVLAGHFAYLATVRKPAPYGRLLVEGNAAAFVRAAAADTAQAGIVFGRILHALEGAGDTGMFGGASMVTRSTETPGMVLVRTGELAMETKLHPRAIANALRAIGGERAEGARARTWAVPETALRAACDY